MSSVEFERAVLRELDQIRNMIAEGLSEARRANCTLDDELSELRLKFAKLELKSRESAPPRRSASWMRDGGLVLTPSLLIPLLQWLAGLNAPPAPPQPAPSAVAAPAAPAVQPLTQGR